MVIRKILALVILLTFDLFSQADMVDDTSNVETKRILRSYITLGYGRIINHKNWEAGVGWFLPLGENILIGTRANVNTEMDAFPLRVPEENIWDVDLVVKYIPFISERLFFSIGAGVGYCRAAKRGEFIRYQLIVAEYERVYSSSISLLGELEADLLITNNIGFNVVGYTLFADSRTFACIQIGIFLCKILEVN